MTTTNCYIYADNEKAVNHFKALGATLTPAVKDYYIDGEYDDYYDNGGLYASAPVFYVSGVACCASGKAFHRYLVDNGLLRY